MLCEKKIAGMSLRRLKKLLDYFLKRSSRSRLNAGFYNSSTSIFTIYPTLLFLRREVEHSRLRKLFLRLPLEYPRYILLAPAKLTATIVPRNRFCFSNGDQRNWIMSRGGVTDSLFRFFFACACFSHPKRPVSIVFRVRLQASSFIGKFKYSHVAHVFVTTNFCFADAFLLQRKLTPLNSNLISR